MSIFVRTAPVSTLSRWNPYFNKELHREENVTGTCGCAVVAIDERDSQSSGFYACLSAQRLHRSITRNKIIVGCRLER